MTGRDPIFGRRHAPYAGGTGNAQAGPSAERQEREDEEGISRARQTLVLGFLDREGPVGMTIKELSKVTGWHHGQSSNALSVLDTAGEIVRLDERREGQSVYVLKIHTSGRGAARKRRSAADKARMDLADALGKIELLTSDNETLSAHVAQSDALVGEMSGRLSALERRVAELTEERDMFQQRAILAQERLEQVEDELTEMTRENAAHRLSAHLRMTLEPDETEVVLRVGTMLGDPRAQNLQDDYKITSTLGVIRTLMRIVGRSTKFESDDKSPSS